MNITDYMEENGHEQLIVHVDRETALKAIMAIHDTTLGPALGPPRMAPYATDEEAIFEALRFSHAQTYKYASAGLSFGGGRIIVIGEPEKQKNEALVRALGRFVKTMGGGYIITGGGVGFTEADTELLRQETSYIVGLPTEMGGSGEPALFAAYSVYLGIKVCAKEVFGSDSLKGKTVAIQGLGKVGSALADRLKQDDVRLIISDIRAEATNRARTEYEAEIIEPDAIYDAACDIFAPCAWGSILNSETIPRLKCKIVAGSANNQLQDRKRHARELQKRGVLYAPEYIINAGGFINIASEVGGYKPEVAKAGIEKIPEVLEKIISMSKTEHLTTLEAADRLAEARIQQARREGRGN